MSELTNPDMPMSKVKTIGDYMVHYRVPPQVIAEVPEYVLECDLWETYYGDVCLHLVPVVAAMSRLPGRDPDRAFWEPFLDDLRVMHFG